MADRIIKPDDTYDLVLQNNHGNAKIEVNEDDTVVVYSIGNFSVDSTGDIILDADGADVTLKDGGTTFGTLKQVSGDLVIQPTSSKQIILNEDGGAAALTIDTDGNTEIAQNIEQADGKNIQTDEVRARDGDGLKLYDDSGAAGIFVEDGGNVGIGTTTPGATRSNPFEVYRGSDGHIAIFEGAGGRRASIYADASSGVLFGSDSGTMGFFSNNSSVKMIMDTSGNIGIAETTPSKLLDLKNGASGGDILCYDIYTHDGGVETSDERMKENIVTSTLGLDFINALNPVSYKWKDVDEIIEKKTVEKQKTIKVEKEVTRTEIVEEDGKYIQKEITETQEIDEPVFNEMPLYDENGQQLDSMHKVPVMEEVEEIINQYDAETYTRTHYGMIAQEVGKVLKEVGLESKDFAGYIYEEDRDRFGLRYSEFISPLIKAVQELSAKVTVLENA
jgi:hypothetical protein